MTTQDDNPAYSSRPSSNPTPDDEPVTRESSSEADASSGTTVDPPTSDPQASSAPSADGSAAEDQSLSTSAEEEQLVPESAVMDFKARWEAIQQGFVDNPRSAVTDADKLVGEVLQKLSTTFEEQHRELEGQWSDGEPSTEDLRSALQRYRAFFDRLLSI